MYKFTWLKYDHHNLLLRLCRNVWICVRIKWIYGYVLSRIFQKMDGMDKLDISPRFFHVFGWEKFPNSLKNCCLVSWSKPRPRTITELFSLVYIICPASTVTKCVRCIRTELPSVTYRVVCKNPLRTCHCA